MRHYLFSTTGDVNMLSRFFSQLVIHILGNSLLLVGILLILWFENALAGLCLTLFALLALAVLLGLRLIAIAPWAEYRQISAEFYGTLGEQIAGRADLRANGGVGYIMHRFFTLLQRWLPVYQKARFTSTILWFSSVGLFTIGNAIALALSAYLWNQTAITIGTAYLIFHYTNLLAQPIEQIREELEQLQQVEASIDRIQALLDVKPRLVDQGHHSLPTGALSVSCDQVWFSYEEIGDGKREAQPPPTPHSLSAEASTVSSAEPRPSQSPLPTPQLQSLSFHLPAGQVLGVLGRTGSGKSTIARLLLRLYDIGAG
jgi:ATP-binding cassette subfamily B protein/ATP-binding cassette subfamily C protein